MMINPTPISQTNLSVRLVIAGGAYAWGKGVGPGTPRPQVPSLSGRGRCAWTVRGVYRSNQTARLMYSGLRQKRKRAGRKTT